MSCPQLPLVVTDVFPTSLLLLLSHPQLHSMKREDLFLPRDKRATDSFLGKVRASTKGNGDNEYTLYDGGDNPVGFDSNNMGTTMGLHGISKQQKSHHRGGRNDDTDNGNISDNGDAESDCGRCSGKCICEVQYIAHLFILQRNILRLSMCVRLSSCIPYALPRMSTCRRRQMYQSCAYS
jgi:hypothetical protein